MGAVPLPALRAGEVMGRGQRWHGSGDGAGSGDETGSVAGDGAGRPCCSRNVPPPAMRPNAALGASHAPNATLGASDAPNATLGSYPPSTRPRPAHYLIRAAAACALPHPPSRGLRCPRSAQPRRHPLSEVRALPTIHSIVARALIWAVSRARPPTWPVRGPGARPPTWPGAGIWCAAAEPAGRRNLNSPEPKNPHSFPPGKHRPAGGISLRPGACFLRARRTGFRAPELRRGSERLVRPFPK